MYITYSEYTALYDPIEEKVFNRLAFDACRYLDRVTTGLDGVKKLRVSFPEDEDSAAAVRHCAARVVNILYQIQEAEHSASLGRGYTETANGLQGKVISSVSAGGESITYAAKSGSGTGIDAAADDPAFRTRMILNTVCEDLSGIADANGVNLLYMGVYPHV